MFNLTEELLRDTNIVFVEESIDVKLKCLICNNLLIDAHIAPCLHKFCRKCIHDHLENSSNKKCVGTNQLCSQTFLNMADSTVLSRCFETNASIGGLEVYCQMSGCDKIVRLYELEHHMMSECDFRIVTCHFKRLGCASEDIKSSELESHLRESADIHDKLICDEIEKVKNSMLENNQEENVVKDKMVALINTLENKNNFNNVTMKQISLVVLIILIIFSIKTNIQTNVKDEMNTLQTNVKDEMNTLQTNVKKYFNEMKQELDQLKILLGPVIEREQREKDNKRECVIEIEDDFIKKFESLENDGDEILIDEETVYLKLRKFKMKVYLSLDCILKVDAYDVLVTLKLERGKYEDEVNLKEEFIIEVSVIDKDGERWGRKVEFVANERLKEESEKEWVVGGSLNDFKNEILVNNKLKLELKIK